LGVVRERSKKTDITDDRKWRDLLSQFIAKAQHDKVPFTEEQAYDVVISFMIAGRDTTATLLTWTFYELAQHPDLEEKVVAEIHEMLKTSGDPPSYDVVLRDLPYTHAFLCEVLRLHPPVPSDSKVAKEEDVLPDGTVIPKNGRVIYMPYIFGRLESIWGPTANQFDPSRWLKMTEEPSQYAFITFNAGPRLCLGKQMAFYEAKMLLAMLLPRFKFSLVPDHPIQYKVSIILQLKYGLSMTVSPRSAPAS